MELKNHLINGLRPNDDMPSNAPFMETNTNLMACERGEKQLPSITQPAAVSAITVSHPHPQFKHEEDVYLLADAIALYTFSPSALTKTAITTYSAQAPADTLALQGSAAWQLAAFRGGSWFMTNGGSLAFKMASNTGDKACVTRTDSTPTLGVYAVANHHNMLVMGGMFGDAVTRGTSTAFDDFFDKWLHSDAKDVYTTQDDVFDTSWIMYSPPGGGDNEIPFTAMMALLGAPGITAGTIYDDKFKDIVAGWVESGQMGLYPCRHTGTIRAMKSHNGNLIVYGDRGVSRLTMTERGFKEELVYGTGIAGRAAVNGDDSEHVFVSKVGKVLMLGERGASYPGAKALGDGLYLLGYKEYVGALTLNDALIVSFDPNERFFWITSSVTCYLLSRTGLSKSDAVQVLSTLRASGSVAMLGTGTSTAGGAVTLLCHKFDGEKKEIWEVQHADIAGVDTGATAADRWIVSMDARLQKQNAFTTFTAVNTDGRGTARVSQSGAEFKWRGTVLDRTTVDLDNVHIREGKGKPSMAKWL